MRTLLGCTDFPQAYMVQAVMKAQVAPKSAARGYAVRSWDLGGRWGRMSDSTAELQNGQSPEQTVCSAEHLQGHEQNNNLSSTSQIVTSTTQERGRTGVTSCSDRCGTTVGTENRIWYFQNQAGRCGWRYIDPGTAAIMAVIRWVTLHSTGLLQDSCGRSIPQTAAQSPPASAAAPAELEPIPGAHGYPHNCLPLVTDAS